MAREVKKGLDYFPMEVDFFNDIKVRKLIRYQSGEALTIYLHLLCTIYKQGYYMLWDDDLPFVISEQTGSKEGRIAEVLKCCLSIGLFDQKIFNDHKIITSKGIQQRFAFILKSLKRKFEIKEYSLIDSEEMAIYSEEIRDNSEVTPVHSGFMQERKGKERKEKEIKCLELELDRGRENEFSLSENLTNSKIQNSDLPEEEKKEEKKVAQKKEEDFQAKEKRIYQSQKQKLEKYLADNAKDLGEIFKGNQELKVLANKWLNYRFLTKKKEFKTNAWASFMAQRVNETSLEYISHLIDIAITAEWSGFWFIKSSLEYQKFQNDPSKLNSLALLGANTAKSRSEQTKEALEKSSQNILAKYSHGNSAL